MDWNHLLAGRTALMRRSAVRELLRLTNRPGMISFAGGLPAPELFPVDEIRAAADQLLEKHGPVVLQYGETEGVAELRDWVAQSLSKTGLALSRDHVLITTGSQQGLDLIGRVFIDADDRVAVENPTYLAALSAWRPWQPKLLPLACDDDGLTSQAIASLPSLRPKFLYTIPNFQNPTGVTLSLERRKQLVAALAGSGTLLVEDDPYGDLRYRGEALPGLLELIGGPEPQLLRLGSFSKVLAPGLRVGFVVGPAALIERLALAKQALDLHTATFNQWLVLELLRNGVVDRNLPKLRAAYGERCSAMLDALEKHLGGAATWTRPEGGMFVFARLGKGASATELLARAVERGVAFVPGGEFHVDGTGEETLRLNFSHASPEKIREGVKRIAEAVDGLM